MLSFGVIGIKAIETETPMPLLSLTVCTRCSPCLSFYQTPSIRSVLLKYTFSSSQHPTPSGQRPDPLAQHLRDGEDHPASPPPAPADQSCCVPRVPCPCACCSFCPPAPDQKRHYSKTPKGPPFLLTSPITSNQHHLFVPQFIFGHFTEIAPTYPPTSAEQEGG